MSAYHNSDWAECYDLWLRLLFGDGPAEDVPVFKEALQDIIWRGPASADVSIVDVGTGTGRVPIELLKVMNGAEGKAVHVWGIEPSASMLDRAKRLWVDAVRKRRNDSAVRITDHWLQGGAEEFAEAILQDGHGADLVIFAAGGICHVIKDEDVGKFLQNVHAVMKPHGRAMISILRTYMLTENSPLTATVYSSPSATSPGYDAPRRIPSQDHPGITYVKHPTSETPRGRIRTEAFKLEVEDNQGNVLRSHELSWDARMFDEAFWRQKIEEAGLRVEEVKEGEIQVWWVLERK